jgi:hypothetical protein
VHDIRQDHYLKHEPCPKCGSRDNLARYSSGSGYCFGCGHFEPAQLGSLLKTLEHVGEGRQEESVYGVRPLPDDLVSYYPPKVVSWIAKYDLAPVDLINHNVCWSPSREQLIYRFYGKGANVVLWQARNFREGTDHKRRFFTSGPSEDIIAKYSTRESNDTCCIVEDCISAIKLAYAGVHGVPCLGSTMSRKKIVRMSRLYKRMVVWLDADKLKEARDISEHAAACGLETKVVYTEDDPKVFSINSIKGYIK